MIKTISILTACLGAVLLSPAASAQQVLQNGSGVCKSALPVFDGNIRNRPTAISNEGTAHAFVSCSMDDVINGESDIVGAWIHNNSTSAQNVTCTFVNGTPVDDAQYFTKTGNFGAGTGTYLFWTAEADNAGENFGMLVNFSCNLPAGVELRLVTRNAPVAP